VRGGTPKKNPLQRGIRRRRDEGRKPGVGASNSSRKCSMIRNDCAVVVRDQGAALRFIWLKKAGCHIGAGSETK